MRIVILGGTGLVGAKLVRHLAQAGHEAIVAARSTGVDTVTGEGLPEALEGAAAVIDASNSSSPAFFETSTGHLLAAEGQARVPHHVALSVVGAERLSESGHFRAKLAQERLIRRSPIPYSIVRSTLFFESIAHLAAVATVGEEVRPPLTLIQPIAADDVAAMVCRVCVGPPVNGIVEVAGPDRLRLDRAIRRELDARDDPRPVIADPDARYFGARVNHDSLLPGDEAQLAETHFEDWLTEP
jgi:uncharacterized protein YbjT (DUF2867 family)